MGIPARQNKKEPRSLSAVFNAFARESVARFPDVKGKLLIHDTNENTTYGRDALKKSKRALSAVDAFVQKRTEDKNRQTYADRDQKLKLFFILYDEPVNENEFKAISEKSEKDVLFLLDHELAHLVIKDPPLQGETLRYKDSIIEAVADAYALIRHYQRYGTDSDHKSTMIDPWARAGALALNGDAIHFTTLMLEEIIKRKDVIDFASLDPQQTAELASRFAVAYTPPVSTVNNIFKKLKSAQEKYTDAPTSNKWLKELARLTFDPQNDHLTFRIYKNILEGYLDGRKDMDGCSFKAKGAYWDDIRTRLKEADGRYNREDILFNIPQMKTTQSKAPRAPKA